jgi:hypothetical protein
VLRFVHPKDTDLWGLDCNVQSPFLLLFTQTHFLRQYLLPSTIFSLDEGLFNGCPNLKTVIIPPGTKAKFLQMGLDFLKDKLIFSQVE